MVVRLHNVGKWSVWEPKTVLQVDSDDPQPRLVRVHVNCPVKTRFDLSAEGVLVFVGVVDGMDVLEFNVAGGYEITMSQGDALSEVWYHTEDGRDVTVEFPDSKSFVRMMNRRERNPAQEWAEMMVLQGQRRRDAELAETRAEFAAQLKAMRDEYAASLPKPEEANGDDGADGGVSGDDAARAAGGAGGAGQQSAAGAPDAKKKKGASADGAAGGN